MKLIYFPLIAAFLTYCGPSNDNHDQRIDDEQSRTARNATSQIKARAKRQVKVEQKGDVYRLEINVDGVKYPIRTYKFVRVEKEIVNGIEQLEKREEYIQIRIDEHGEDFLKKATVGLGIRMDKAEPLEPLLSKPNQSLTILDGAFNVTYEKGDDSNKVQLVFTRLIPLATSAMSESALYAKVGPSTFFLEHL